MASTLPASKSGLYADPREDWLAQYTEEIIDPGRPIVDPHHHLWDRGGQRYLIDELAADIASGHNIIATVYVEARSMYRAGGPEAMRAGRRGRIRQRRGGDERERRLRPGRDLRRHRRPRRSSARRGARAVLEARDRRRPRAAFAASGIPRLGTRIRKSPACMRRGRKACLLDPAFRRGLCLPRAAEFEFRCLAVSSADRRPHRSRPRLSGTKIVLDHCGGPLGLGSYAGKREEIFARAGRASIQDIAKCPERRGQARRAGDAAARL